MIGELIEKLDNFEKCQNRIVEILSLEIYNQMQLATAAAKDPTPWDIRVFMDRSSPWEAFMEGDLRPVVNVTFSRADMDARSSSLVNEATFDGEFLVDVFGFGVAMDTDEGFDPADYVATQNAKRAFRIVRNILLAGENTNFGIPEITQRTLVSMELHTPSSELVSGGSVCGIRGNFRLRYSEETPQVTGEVLGEMHVDFGLAGEIISYPL